MSKNYPMPIVLTAYTGVLVTEDFSGVHEFLEYMVGGPVWTHQLPRVADECKPWLLRRHPFLANVDASSVNGDNWREWVNAEIEKHGESVYVEPIPQDDVQHIDPITEAKQMNPDIEIIPLVIDDGGERS